MLRRLPDALQLAASLAALGAVTWACAEWLHAPNAATVSTTYLLVVLVVAATSRLWMAVATSIDRLTMEVRDRGPGIRAADLPHLFERFYRGAPAATGASGTGMGLPDLDGTEVCRRIRAVSTVPIVVLSARGAEADTVNALDLGADDYVTKPFGPEELLARIRVALRRVMSGGQETGQLRAGDLTIDYDRRRALRGDMESRLTPKEFDLLSLLARNHDRVLTHRAILKAIWGGNAVEQPEHLWTLVAQLRRKIEPDSSNPRYLLSEPWVGYRFSTGESGTS
jgi:two-component system KDP operon response regulator KdpE